MRDRGFGRAWHPLWIGDPARPNHPASDGEAIREGAASIAATQVPAVDQTEERKATYNDLCNLLARTGKAEEALGAPRKALAICQKLVTDHPAVPGFQYSLALSYDNIGWIL